MSGTGRGPWADARHRLAQNRLAVSGGAAVALIAFLCFVLPPFFGMDPATTHPAAKHLPPSAAHFLGTDSLGREYLARVLVGGQTSLLIGFTAALASILVGVLYGAVSGYYGGRIDDVMMRIVDFLYGIPYMFLVILIMLLFSETARGNPLPVFLALGLVEWLTMARVVRGQVLTLRDREFVLAARLLGASDARVILRHLLPNVAGVVTVYGTLTVPAVIILESFLSFLGLGVKLSWGQLVAEAVGVVNPIRSYWWLLFFPSVLLATTLFSLNFLGDGLRDAVDPKGAPMTAPQVTPLLDVQDLHVEFRSDGSVVRAVDGVSFSLEKGKVLGVVGESGCGKSATGLSILRLLPREGSITEGRVLFDGVDLATLPDEAMRRIRGRRIAMIFQDPMTSLNPYLRVEEQLAEVGVLHLGLTKEIAIDRAVALLDRVGIPDARARARGYPHELSGGMRQRVMIAMALLCDPELLIADEPTTALDVTIQAEILELLRELALERGLSVILITHDLGVVAGLADQVLVMYAGRAVERGPARDVLNRPLHPYTLALLRSVPRLERRTEGPLESIGGMPPRLGQEPFHECAFAPRCRFVHDACRTAEPELVSAGLNRLRRCVLPEAEVR